jgi:hypothetical protein
MIKGDVTIAKHLKNKKKKISQKEVYITILFNELILIVFMERNDNF